ncbi:MAG: hypothetical protein WC848_01175 [Parcubacteria group bacterium]|jgi:hypothetical protein
MFESQIKKRYFKFGKRVCQGDILKEVAIYLGFSKRETDGGIKIKDFYPKYVVVLSQDCDLESDCIEREKNKEKKKLGEVEVQDKYLPTILLCPAYPINDFIEGKHIAEWKMSNDLKHEKKVKKLKKNDDLKRYHYLAGDASNGIPELVVDFKHFMTVPRDELYEVHPDVYVSTLCELFREELSQRFTNYLSRIGLPVFSNEIDAKNK